MTGTPVIPVRDFECLLYGVRDHVAVITLNRPQRHNALNRRAYDEVRSAFIAASADDDVRCVVVTGADPAFCSGEDVKEMMTGDKPWRAPPLQLQAADEAPFSRLPRRSQLFRQGLFAAVSNPKALLFYGAFLPQFIDPARSLWLQFVVMAGTFVVTECCVEFLLARLAHFIRPALERMGKRFNRVCGGLFAAMGLALPLTR
jgi:hypothetical protein